MAVVVQNVDLVVNKQFILLQVDIHFNHIIVDYIFALYHLEKVYCTMSDIINMEELHVFLNEYIYTGLMPFGIIFWSMLYIIVLNTGIVTKKMDLTDKLDIYNRIVSIVHGYLLTFGCGYEFFVFIWKGNYDAGCGQENNDLQKFILCASISYFIYDFLAMAYYGLLDWAMSIHHFVSVLGQVLTLASGHSAILLMCGMFVGEISNPSMHFRMILRHLGLRYTLAYEILEILFIVFYILGRMVVATPTLYYIDTCSSVNIILKVCLSMLWVQSFYFICSSMVGMLIKRFKEIDNRTLLNVPMKGLFTPLTKDELKQLGINSSEEKKATI